MKKLLTTLLAMTLAISAFAQGSILKPVLTITETTIHGGPEKISVFDFPEEGQHHYFLDAGILGVGDDIIQVNIDPVFRLFVPLGNTLADAQDKLEEFIAMAKQPVGTEIETTGTLALANPSMGDYEAVYVTTRSGIFQRIVEFSIRRDTYIRGTFIAKSELKALLTGMKIYSKIHPDE